MLILFFRHFFAILTGGPGYSAVSWVDWATRGSDFLVGGPEQRQDPNE